MATFKYELTEAVRMSSDLRVPQDDGPFLLEVGTLIDIDDAERWGITTAAAELAKADAPRKTCSTCGSVL